MKLLMLLSLVLYLCSVESLKILVCYPLPVKSLSILGQGAVRYLLDAGHEVTYITVYPLKTPPSKNFRQIDLSSNDKNVGAADDEKLSIRYILENKQEKNDAKLMQDFAKEYARKTFQNVNIIELLQDPNERFDAVIVDLYETEIYSGLAVLYDCPMIWLYSMGAHWQVLRLIDEGTNPAYDPDYLSTRMSPLSFSERINELWARIKWQALKTYAKRAKELSFIYHDRHTKPGADLVHWVQHVVRTRGAPHLRSPAMHMPLYQRLYLDLLAIILGTASLFGFIVSSMCKKSPKKNDQKKKN